MTSSGEGPKLVGSVVDPLALGPGETEEPQVSSGHPVRDRLLEKARQAKAIAEAAERPIVSEAEMGRGGFLGEAAPRSGPRTLELQARGGHGKLSPNMMFLFSTLLGLAVVASLIALVMNVDRSAAATHPAAADVPKAIVGPPVRHKGAVAKRQRQKVPGPWRIRDAKNQAGTRILEGKVGFKAFLTAVQDAGLAKKEAYRILIAFKGVKDFDRCDKTDLFSALVEEGTGTLKAFEYEISKEEVYQATLNDQGHLRGQKLDLKVERVQVKGAILHDGKSFTASAKRAGFEPGLADVLGKALDGHLDLEELEDGDRLRVLAQEVTVLGEFSRYAGVEAVEVLPRDGKALRIYYFHHGQEPGYYDARGRAPYEGGWRKPVKDAPVTSKFNPNRLHPVLKRRMPHNGTDFGAPTGTPVLASSYGTVSFIGYAGASGNLVKVDHPGGVETGYAHLSRFADGLKVGDKVKRLQLVGYVGSTGRSTGPHLHFSARKDGKFFDAETLSLDGMRVLSKDFREEFTQTRQKYDELLNAVALPEVPPKVVAPEPVAAAEQDDPAAAEELAENEEDESAMGGDEIEEEEASEAVAAPQAAAAAAPPSTSKNALYLSDAELMKMQAASDDGEVPP